MLNPRNATARIQGRSGAAIAAAALAIPAQRPSMLINGLFNAGAAPWTYGTGWAHDPEQGGRAVCDGTQLAVTLISQPVPALVNLTDYRVIFDLHVDAGAVTVNVGGTLGGATNESGHKEVVITASTASLFAFDASTTFEGWVDNITLWPA